MHGQCRIVAAALMAGLCWPPTGTPTGTSTSAFGQTTLFSFTKKADSETQVPNQTSGTTFLDFGLPSIHENTVAFRSAINSAEDRVDKVLSNGTIVEVFTTDANGPFVNEPRRTLGDVTIYKGNVGLSGTSNDQGHTQFRTAGNALQSHEGDLGGRANFYGNTIAFPINSAADNPPRRVVVEGGVSSFLGTVVQVGDSVPQTPFTDFQSFGDYVDHNLRPSPFNPNLPNHGSVVFLGLWSGGNLLNSEGGIYRWQQTGPQTGSIIRIADPNVEVPGPQPGFFHTPTSAVPTRGFQTTHHDNVPSSFLFSAQDFDPSTMARPSLHGTTVAFSFDDTANNTNGRAGVYTHSNSGVVQIVADRNTPHPTLGGTFDGFEGVSTVGSTTAFIGSRGGVNGLYLEHCNDILEVTREGISFDETKVVSNIELGHRGLAVSKPAKFNSSLEVAFRAEFTDGSEGIYTAKINQHCAPPLGLIGNALKPFDPTDPDTGPIGGQNFFSVPIYDDAARLETSLLASASNGAPVVFGGDFAAQLFGVQGEGANDDLIDYAVTATGVVSEQVAIRYNQPVLVEALHLRQFDLTDSAMIQIGEQSIRVTGGEAPDGYIDLSGLSLRPGSAITIGWDPLNRLGDGFSYNGMLFKAIPEPAAIVLMAAAASCTVGRRRRILY